MSGARGSEERVSGGREREDGARAVSLVCEGCGAVPPPLARAPYPFRCERAGRAGEGAIDHVVAPRLVGGAAVWPRGDEARPFVKYRRVLHAHAAAIELGLGDEGYLAIVERLDRAIERVDGRSFCATPLVRSAALGEAVGLGGEVWIKDETRNVSGSHKGRHLFGVLVHLELVRAAGLEVSPPPSLAIASCGNAALAAAVLARAAERQLAVMVPPDAHPRVLARLRELGADVQVCARSAPGSGAGGGSIVTDGARDEGHGAAGVNVAAGDPTVAAFRRAVAAGALPFACQGTECGLTLDGGKTLGFEVIDAGVPFDRAFVQVGGGALASSFARAFDDARALGVIERRPRLMTVQTEAVAPLARAYDRLVGEVRARLAGGAAMEAARSAGGQFLQILSTAPTRAGDPGERAVPSWGEPRGGDALADVLRAPGIGEVTARVLGEMAHDRAAWLPPWPAPRSSAAHGILDDETYDALAILRAMVASGGWPIVVDEATVLEAEAKGREATGIDVDATGTAGLAGLLAWSRRPDAARGERVAALFTGARR